MCIRCNKCGWLGDSDELEHSYYDPSPSGISLPPGAYVEDYCPECGADADYLDEFDLENQIELEEADIGTTVSLSGRSESGKALTYLSDAPATAVVDSSGIVTITGTGRAKITISAPSTRVFDKASVIIFIKVKSEESSGEDDLINGIFNGQGKGYGGIVTAAVTIEDSLIKAISVEGKNETDKYWFKAKKITSKMISNQTWDVDAVSGATLSSNGIRDAVKQALQEAGLIS